MFSLIALLSKDSPLITVDALEAQLSKFFKTERELKFGRARLPFLSADSIDLRWGTWRARLSYEEGPYVVEDSVEISKILGGAAPFDLSAIDRRIRVVFSDDKNQERTNEVIYVMDFLKEIPGVVIFDPQQNNLLT